MRVVGWWVSNPPYDFLDRLTSASGAYSASYTYNEIGNIMSMNGVNYTYGGSQPHAVTSVGNTSYAYDTNGNMITRGDQTITWDMANRPVSVTDGVNTSTFAYDGDGNRIMKIENDETIIYVNRYLEWNITTGEITTHYYLGGNRVAYKANNDLRYVHQDHLSSTSLTTSASGAIVASVKYFPYGTTRSATGTLDTDKLFTGQRLDDTGLYYYNARYYDATIGRLISADTIVPNYRNPQSLNRYSYCYNNPLKYIDPSGHNAFTDWWTKSLPDFFCGVGDSFKSTWHAITHLRETFNAISQWMAQPDYVAMGQIADDLKTRFTTARGLGRTTGDILQAFLLTKGLNAVSKAVGSTAKATTLTGDAALSAEAGAKTAISTWSSRYTQAGETFYHYGYAEQAASFSRGLRARSYATTEGGLTGAEATSRLALGQALSPDAVYVVTPKPGTFIWTNPVTSPKYGRPGGLPEIFFPIGTGPGTVSGPFPIP